MIVVPYKAEHLTGILVQDSQQYLRGYLNPAHAEAVEAYPAFTALDGNRVLGCAGILPLWNGRAQSWAFLAGGLERHFISIHRAVKRYLDVCGVRRIECAVDVGFEEGHRWAEMLGFKRETPEPMLGYREDGGACFLYARVQA